MSIDSTRWFPEEGIKDTIEFFKNHYSMELEHIEDFDILDEYNYIKNSDVDDKGINHYITGNDVINYYLFVTPLPNEQKIKCEIVIILEKLINYAKFLGKIHRIVLFESYPYPTSIDKSKKTPNFEKKSNFAIDIFDFDSFKNKSSLSLKTYRIKNYEEITYLPNMEELNKIVFNIKKSWFRSLFGGKKSKRKLIRKSNRKSKKLKKLKKTQKIKKHIIKSYKNKEI